MLANNIHNNDFNLNQYSTRKPKWYHKMGYFFCGSLSCRKNKFCCCNPHDMENGNAQSSDASSDMRLVNKSKGNNMSTFYNHMTGQNHFMELFNDIQKSKSKSKYIFARF